MRLLWLGMRQDKTALERTFELARTGKYATVTDLKRAVAAEGYGLAQITGGALAKQLRQIIAAHRGTGQPVASAGDSSSN